MSYRWIVIENSLKDKSVINKYQVLSETKFAASDPKRESRMLKVRVPETEVHSLAESLTKNIIYPYYTHFYHEDPKQNILIVVFFEKKFTLTKDDFKAAVEYGLKHGVSQKELDISPRDISEEDW